MTSDGQRAKALRFREMHTSGNLLILPNAWDGGSACVFERVGFQAIGTTSAGIAYSLGYPDGERMSRDEMIEGLRRITRAVSVPVVTRGNRQSLSGVVEKGPISDETRDQDSR